MSKQLFISQNRTSSRTSYRLLLEHLDKQLYPSASPTKVMIASKEGTKCFLVDGKKVTLVHYDDSKELKGYKGNILWVDQEKDVDNNK